MAHWLFWIKLKKWWKQGGHWPSCFPVKQISQVKYMLPASGGRTYLSLKLGSSGWEACINKPCYFKLLPQVQTLFYFWLCWVFVAVWAVSSCGEWGLLSSCGAKASHWGDFSCHRAQALGCVGFGSCSSRVQSRGSVVVARILSRSTTCDIFLDQGWNPHLLHRQVDSWPQSHQGSPQTLFRFFTK